MEGNTNFVQKFDDLFMEITDKIDFKGGQIEKLIQEKPVFAGTITVCWKKNVKLVLSVKENHIPYYCVTRNNEEISASYYVSKFDDTFFRIYQGLLNQVKNGDFDFKKTISDRILKRVNISTQYILCAEDKRIFDERRYRRTDDRNCI